MHDYRRLNVYADALDLAVDAYRIARSLPATERLELSSQLRRASTSVSINIAEGTGRTSDREFIRYLRIAVGSACEVEALVDLILRLHSVDQQLASELQSDARKLIKRIHKLEQRVTQP